MKDDRHQRWRPTVAMCQSDDLAIDRLELFVQPKWIIIICRNARSLAEAGRTLFDVSRTRKSITNDSDWLRKYLARFGLDFERVR